MKKNDSPLLFNMQPVVRKGRLAEIDETTEDILYWRARPAQERIAAVTFLVLQSLPKGARMDKSIVVKRKLKMK
jgi:hypothetical protein